MGRKKYKYVITETYSKTIEVNSSTENRADKLAKEQAKGMCLGQEYKPGGSISFTRDIVPTEKPAWWDRLNIIAEETDVNWYQKMQPWQRKELSQKELYQYAEEMRIALERIFDIAYEFERQAYKQ